MPSSGNAINVNSPGVVSFTGTSFSESAITQYDTLVGGASQTITSVGPGTAGGILISGGASADPSYVVPTAGTGTTVTTNASTLEFALSGGGGGDFVLIDTQTATSTNFFMKFTTGITSTYSTYFLLMYVSHSYPPSQSIALYLSSDGGATYGNPFSYYGCTIALNTSGAVVTYLNTGSSGFFLGFGTGVSTAGYIGVYLHNLTNGSYPSITGEGLSPTEHIVIYTWGSYIIPAVINAMLISFADQGSTCSLYGIK